MTNQPHSDASGPVTFVDLWHMSAMTQDGFVDVAVSTLGDVVSKMPGFRGAHVLRSINGLEVIVQIEWESMTDVQAMEDIPELGQALRELRGVAHQDRNTYHLAARILA